MADLRSSNPVLRRGGFAPPPTPTPEELASHYRQPTTLTVDDVVVHTLGLFALLGVGGAVGWVVGRDAPGIALAAGLVALVISLVVSMRNRLRPSLVIAFALIEGVAVGAISRFYEDDFAGIVPQALLGTGLIFVAMLLAYRSRRLRATPRMARIVTGVLFGVVLLSLVDLVVRAVSGSHLPVINDATPLGILFSVLVLG
ncbi:Bax inhibitor-1/YccA family protein, partial [Frankia sp. ACN1ag]